MTSDTTAQGVPKRAQLDLGSKLSELSRLRFFVREFWDSAAGFVHDESGADALMLAVNEVAANVIRHAFKGLSGRRFTVSAEAWPDRVVVELSHDGQVFTQKGAPACLPPEPQDHGYGLYIIENSLDGVSYLIDDQGRQRIIMEKRPRPHPA